jgi:CubicO group peptidase (beta-lactamase class C family)
MTCREEVRRSHRARDRLVPVRVEQGAYRRMIGAGREARTVLRYVGPMLATVILAGCATLIGCGPTPEELKAVAYAPLRGQGWAVSTPEAQGLDPMLVARLYYDAARVETLQALLVVKNGCLIAERYFRGGGIDEKTRVQSVTKSYTSALVGIALERGCLSSVDQNMMHFFPELADRVADPRKNRITIRHMLQMRAGYPWEESTPELFKMLYSGFRPSLLVEVPLVRDPGSGFDYSNLTSHLLAVIVARATGMDLKSFAQTHLFAPLGVKVGEWIRDWEGYRNGHADLYFNARDMAKFGLLYLNNGVHESRQLVPAAWVHDSLKTYSGDAWRFRVGRNVTHMGYGYQWWSVRAGEHTYHMAWGHGGQQIVLVHGANMVIVVKADPLFGEHGDGPWRKEKANLNLVGDFVASLPGE